MKRQHITIITMLLCCTVCLAGAATTADSGPGTERHTMVPLLFQENRGQIVDTDGKTRADVAFIASLPGMRMYVRSDGISYVFTDGSSTRGTAQYRIDMTLEGCNPSATIRGEDLAHSVVHYYLPHCPSGIAGIREYRSIVYENIYDAIDLELLSNGDRIKYNFIVHPGGNAARIRMRYSGTTGVRITESGSLRITTPLGQVEEAAPYCYAGHSDSEVPSSFICDGNVVSFRLDPYDHAQTLVIDPWATYYGGSGTDVCTGVATDASGNVIMTGYTSSTDFPTVSGQQSVIAGGEDAFIVKFDASGTRLWATYFGGSGDERAYVTVDGSGNIILGGTTDSPDLPTTAGTLQPVYGGDSDMYAAKFSASGTLLWATYVGGSGTESNGFNNGKVASDAQGHVLICGSTNSLDYPVSVGAFQTSLSKRKDMDVCVTALTSAGTMHWSTYYGNRGGEGANDIAVDASGNVFVTGGAGDGFPVTPGAYQTSSAGGLDGFIIKFSNTGQRLWATFVGGSDGDWARAVATSPEGSVYVTGYTWSGDYPVTPGAFQTVPPSASTVYDPMISKFSENGSLLWSSYCGGSDSDVAYELAVDGSGNVILTGRTASNDYPVSAGGFQSGAAGGGDGMVTKFSSNGSMLWSTYCGGTLRDDLTTAAVNSSGEVFLGGLTLSTDFPTFAAFQNTLASGPDAVCVALTSSGLIPGYNVPPVAVATAEPSQGIIPLTVSFTGDGSYDLDGTITAYAWDFGDGNTASTANPQHTYTTADTYTVTLTVTDNDLATATATVTITANAAGSYVFVASQSVTHATLPGNKELAEDLVVVRDNNGQPVDGAVVTADYTGPTSGSTSGITGANGEVTLESAWDRNPSGIWCFTVTGVQASGSTFNSSMSVLTACEIAPKIVRPLPSEVEVSVQPNPFKSSATIHYSLPHDAQVILRVYDAVGREVAVLLDGSVSAGIHAVRFDAHDLPGGVYYYRLSADAEVQTGSMVLVK